MINSSLGAPTVAYGAATPTGFVVCGVIYGVITVYCRAQKATTGRQRAEEEVQVATR